MKQEKTVGKMSQSKPEAEQTPLFSLKWYFIQQKIELNLAIKLMSAGYQYRSVIMFVKNRKNTKQETTHTPQHSISAVKK